MTERVGQQLGNYRLLRLVGQGGFADVYLGEHIHLRTQAAIKVLQVRLGESNVRSFLHEARTIAHLVHPYIIRVLDFGAENNIPFLVMDYAPKGTFRQRFLHGKPLPPTPLFPYIRQAATALQHAHDKKFIHRDVKPENMLIGPNDEILLSDFGFAQIQSSLSRSSTETAGTAAYMAPEQLQGQPRPASDQYALGIVAYEWLTGTCPFNGTFYEIASQHMLTPPAPIRDKVPSISPELEHVVLTALAKKPEERFPSVHEFASALERACLSSKMIAISPPLPAQSLTTPPLSSGTRSLKDIHTLSRSTSMSGFFPPARDDGQLPFPIELENTSSTGYAQLGFPPDNQPWQEKSPGSERSERSERTGSQRGSQNLPNLPRSSAQWNPTNSLSRSGEPPLAGRAPENPSMPIALSPSMPASSSRQPVFPNDPTSSIQSSFSNLGKDKQLPPPLPISPHTSLEALPSLMDYTQPRLRTPGSTSEQTARQEHNQFPTGRPGQVQNSLSGLSVPPSPGSQSLSGIRSTINQNSLTGLRPPRNGPVSDTLHSNSPNQVPSTNVNQMYQQPKDQIAEAASSMRPGTPHAILTGKEDRMAALLAHSHSRASRKMMVFLVSMAFFIIFGSIGLFAMANNSQTNKVGQKVTPAGLTQEQKNSTETAIAHSSATAVSASATAQANANPYPPHQGMLNLNEVLDSNNPLSQWEENTVCYFGDGQYNVIAQPAKPIICFANGREFYDFTFQVEMNFLSVAPSNSRGGIVFRGAVTGQFYYFALYASGHFIFQKCLDGISGGPGQCQTLAGGLTTSSGEIASPLDAYKPDESNTLAVTATGSNLTLFLNGKRITEPILDEEQPALTQGLIGVMTYGGTGSTTVATHIAYSNAKVWK